MGKRMANGRLLPWLCAVGMVLGVSGCDRPAGEPAEVELLARSPERGNWSPQTIELETGREVTLVIRNVDVVTHGFYLPALGLSLTEIKAGDVKRLTFTPEAAGEFPFYCSMWCSDYHMQMRGTVIVR